VQPPDTFLGLQIHENASAAVRIMPFGIFRARGTCLVAANVVSAARNATVTQLLQIP